MQFKSAIFAALFFATVSLASSLDAAGKRELWARNCPGGGNEGICAEGQFCVSANPTVCSLEAC